ncbi:MAG: MotA/TolQ/ExbB proton channel family protein [Planctomycetes bacterium]|nr:MotA/TolQ/ExbB proton channel family protein [Planctomycetota bacterium]
MLAKTLSILLPLALGHGFLAAQTPPPAAAEAERPSFEAVAGDVQRRLEKSLAELGDLRERIAAEKLPMDRELREIEAELQAVRARFQEVSRTLELRSLDLSNLRTDIDKRRDQATYLGNVLGEYLRELEAGLHIAELQRHAGELRACKLAQENTTLPEAEVLGAQIGFVATSIGRLQDVLAGTRFQGTAVDPSGLVKQGTFVLVGPQALFRAADGSVVGAAEQRLGSLEPTVIPFTEPADAEAAAQLVLGTGGRFPFDPTLGSAHKVAATKETLLGHFQKGGPVMFPIAALAGAALIVVLLKWLSMAFVRRPSRRLVGQLLESVEAGDRAAAVEQAEVIGGPAGSMLLAGAEHLGEPRDLVEEVMFEQVLSTRLRLQGWLPFVAICATSAPLLGLLGTVTGIMNTFTLMTVHGTGDPKTLSSGISEALITTETGLIVAIPSLLLHAFLSRRARSIVDEMEKLAIAFLNRMRAPAPVDDPEPVEVA